MVGNGETVWRVPTRDSDTKVGRPFDEALKAHESSPVRPAHRAAVFHAHVDRFMQTAQSECLDRFIALGTRHLDHLMAEFFEHYIRERRHSSIEFRTPTGRPPPPRAAGHTGTVRCPTRLGGVPKHYYRIAA